MFTRICAGIFTLFMVSQAWAQVPETVQFQPDLVYGKGGETELKLDLSRPKTASPSGKPVPCIVAIHGGAWRSGNKTGLDPLTWKLAEHGYVSATIGYRFCPKDPFPAQIEDAKCAIRFLRAHAEEYGLDPQRIGAIGFSAGAHLSLLLGVMGDGDGLEGTGGSEKQSSQVQAVVSYFGPTDLNAEDIPEISKPLVKDFVGGPGELARLASPLTYVTTGDAAVLFFQGTKDPLVPHTQTYRMIDALTKADVPARAEILVGAGHGWGGKDLERTMKESVDFFDEQFKHVPTAK